MQKSALVLLAASLTLAGCDINLDLDDGTPASPTGPTTISNTNINTTTLPDRSDTAPSSGPPAGGAETPLPLPSYGEQVTRDVAAQSPALVANSCQETSGESAWRFLDSVIAALRARDPRWGYLCKDASCRTFSRDVVAYRATSSTSGIWIVDVIGNHCPGPTDPPPAVRWGVLPFETARPWSAAR